MTLHAMRSLRQIVAGLALFAGLATARLAAAEDAAAQEEGAKIVAEVCSSCHTKDTRPLEAMRLTREQWKEALDKMEGLGVEVPAGKKAHAMRYHQNWPG